MSAVKGLAAILSFILVASLGAGSEKLSEDINLALGKAPGGFELTADGDLKEGVLLGGSSSEAMMTINLGTQYYLRSINLFWDEKAYFPGYKVEVSINLVNWTEIRRGRSQVLDKPLSLILDEAYPDSEIGQFIRIRVEGSRAVRLNEIEVYPALNVRPEIVGEVRIGSLREGSVEIIWETNIATTGQVHYKAARKPSIVKSDGDIIVIEKPVENTSVALEGIPTKKHKLQLTNLLRGTDYVYWTVSNDLYRNEIDSEQRTFTTPGVPLPLVKSAKVAGRDKDSVVVDWITNVPTKGIISYGREGSRSQSIAEGDFKTAHIAKVENLRPLTTYQYRIDAQDESGNRTEVEGLAFVTGEYNVALFKPISGTFTELPDDPHIVKGGRAPLLRVNDGVTNYFEGMATSGDIRSKDQFVSIDLGEIYEVDKVIVYWRALAYSRDYSVEGSLDGEKWFTIEKNISPDVKLKEGTARPERSDRGDPMAVVETSAGGKKMRYVRIYAERGSDFFVMYDYWNYLQLMEVKVYPVIR